MLSLEGVGVAFGDGQPLFSPVSAQLKRGMCAAVRGPHGAGKSVFLRLLAGLMRPTQGTVRAVFLEDERAAHPTSVAFRRRLGLVLPEHPLLPSRTLIENLVLAQRLVGHQRRSALEAAYTILRRLGLLAVSDEFPRTLSRSQHQLACIARAVLRRPQVLIADEPGAGLRPEAAELARRLLSDAVIQGALVVIAATADDPSAPTPDTVIQIQPASRPEEAAQVC